MASVVHDISTSTISLPSPPAYTLLKSLDETGRAESSTSAGAVDAAAHPERSAILPNLQAGFWAELERTPWKFNESSCIIGGNAASQRVLLVEGSASENSGLASGTHVYRVYKSTYPFHRILHIISGQRIDASTSTGVVFAADSPEDRAAWIITYFLAGIKTLHTVSAGVSAGAGTTDGDVPISAALTSICTTAALNQCLTKLTDLLAWLRGHLGIQETVVSISVSTSTCTVSTVAAPAFLVSPDVISRHYDTSGKSAVGTKRPRAEADAGPATGMPSNKVPRVTEGATKGVALAIIVPFRDQPLQNRGKHLAYFATEMPKFLASIGSALQSFHIFIIEQSDDNYKFNRGKTLNIGFSIASSASKCAELGIPGPFTAFCFHDVDLMPSDVLKPWYAMPPTSPIHIASVWPRYAKSEDYAYVGGILTMSEKDVRATNGFPNNMWGWGGEDDVLQDRMRQHGIVVKKVDKALNDSITDLEEVFIKKDGGVRASAKPKEGGKQEWKCFWKTELRAFHKDTGHEDGVSTLHYNILKTTRLNEHATKITVDLQAASDPAAEKLEYINCDLKPTADTVTVYIAKLKAALEAQKAAPGAAFLPVGNDVIETIKRESYA